MKKLKSKTMAILIALFLTFSMTASMTLIPSASAHSPAWQIPTESFLNVGPNPIGVGQQVTVDFWLMEPPPTAQNQFGDRWQGITVLVTKPDGTTEKLGPFTTDDTGGTFTLYTPSELGNYTFQMSFPGQTLAGNNPPPFGFTAGMKTLIGDYYEPSNATARLTVQQQAISSIPANPLPTSYWTRPINAENNNWYSIAGNWLGFGSAGGGTMGCYNVSCNYNAWSTGPTTAHILWTKPDAFGGTVGGEFGGTETGNFYTDRQYEREWLPIIMNGILYYVEYPGSTQNPAGWAAVDLQTGQTLWTNNAANYGGGSPQQTALTSAGIVTTLRCGQLLDYVTGNQFGALAYLWSIGTPAGINAAAGTTTYNMFDAMTGGYILSIVNGTTMTLTEDQGGDLIGYYVNSTNPSAPTLNEWNSTQVIQTYWNLVGGTNTFWMWRPAQDVQLPFSSGIMWSVPLPTTYSGNALPAVFSISAVNSGVMVLTSSSVGLVAGYQIGWQIEAGYSSDTGAQLWITNRTETPFTRLTGPTSFLDGCGVFVELNLDTLVATGYSDSTGTQLWTITLPNANVYDTYLTSGMVANGTLYLYGMGGDVYAMNILTGAVLWHYTTGTAEYNTPYGIWPIWSQCQSETIADGMLYFSEGHEYSPPLFRGAQEVALNLTDGQPVWSILGFDVNAPAAISDGVLTMLNDYDNQIYAYGMGPSKVTVTAPQASIQLDRSLVISGTVTDISAGAQQQAVAANFPNGLPCVSDASMTPWMEYIYEQQPMPTNATGVPVTLSVIDSNGNSRQIGTTTSDATGAFSFQWTPDIIGKYTVTATFAGSQSYYGSSSEASFAVDSAAPTASPYPQVILPPTEMYIVGGVVAIIIAIAIVGVLMLMAIKKRP